MAVAAIFEIKNLQYLHDLPPIAVAVHEGAREEIIADTE